MIIATLLLMAITELSVAQQALRDGLYAVARQHAERDGSETAKLLILESYAEEGRWDEVNRYLFNLGSSATNAPFAYYRAAVADDYGTAAALLRASGAGSEAAMLEAGLALKRGDRTGAEKLWRGVIASTNAPTRAYIIAAINLGDIAALRRACAGDGFMALRLRAGLRLGERLLGDKHTTEEGAALIRRLVRENPDVEGAREAMLALANSYGDAGNWQASADIYRNMLDIWPDVARRAAFQQGRGEVLMKLAQRDSALEAFVLAEGLATDEATKALAVLRQGDALSELGRGEAAMASYRKVLSSYPETAVAKRLKGIVELRELENRGRELYREFRFAEAERIFAKVATADAAARERMEYLQILCAYGQGKDDEAFDRARKLMASTADAAVKSQTSLWMAKLAYNRRDWAEAMRLFVAFADRERTHEWADRALLYAARAAYAGNELKTAIQYATILIDRYPNSSVIAHAMVLQGESLIGVSRFDEAVLVLERVAQLASADRATRMRARLLNADACYAMGADNPARYAAALELYRGIGGEVELSPSTALTVAFKLGRTLEKLKRRDEAIEQYYARVVLVYRDGVEKGDYYDNEAKSAFSRAVLRLSDEYEDRGQDFQALKILELLVESDLPAADEARKRIERISRKGKFL